MKFTTSKSSLAAALSIAGIFTGGKAIVPILDYFLFKIEDGSLTIVGTNMEIFVSTRIDIQPCGFTRSVAIPVDTLSGLVKALPEAPIEFLITEEKHGPQITIYAGGGEYNMTGDKAEDFPVFEYKGSQSFKMKSADLKTGIQKTIFTVSADKFRPAMQGIYFEVDTEELIFTATDSHKLSTQSFRNKSEVNAALIMPAKLMQALPGLSMTEEIEVTLDASKIMFQVNADTTIQAILVDDRYPDYKSIIPVNQPNELQVDRQGLISILKRTSQFSNSVSNSVQFTSGNDTLTITAENKDFGKAAKENISCSITGEDINIAFNGKYMLEMLQKMTDDTVHISYTLSNRAVLLKESRQKGGVKKNLMLIMPVMPILPIA